MGGTSERVCVGAIAGAHGVRGLVRLKSFTERPEDIFAFGPLTDAAGTRRFVARPAGQSRGALLARLEGIDDRAAAEALTGTRLHVERAALPPLEADEYYHADLVGLAVEHVAGRPLGEVRAVHDFGAGPVLEIAGGAAGSALVPFTRAVVPVVDLAGRRIVVDPPPGLIDEAEEEPGGDG